MKTKILFIGTGAFQALAILQLKREGYYIIGIDGNAEASSNHLCDEFYPIPFTEREILCTLAKQESVSFAISIECDPAVNVVNYINRHLGKQFISEYACQVADNKELTRKLQQDLKLPCPAYFNITTSSQLRSIVQAKKNCLKNWILKPKSSSGSRGVILLEQDSNLEDCYQNSVTYSKTKEEGLLLEEFIDGQEIAIDGFVVNGDIFIQTVSYKDRTLPPHLLDEGLFITANIDNDLVNQGKAQLEKLFSKVESKLSTPFHAELIVNQRFIFIVEFSFRGAGFNVFSQWIPKVTGNDTINQLVSLVNAKSIDFPINKKPINNSIYIGFLSGHKGTLKSIDGEAAIKQHPQLLDYAFYPKVGDDINPLTSGADRIGHIIVEGNNHKETRTLFKELSNTLELTYE